MKNKKIARLAGITAAAVLAFSSLTVCAADGIVTETTQPVPQDMPSEWPEQSPEWPAAGQSYVEQNGLQFYPGTMFKTQGYRCDPDSLYQDFEFIDVDGAVNGITICNADKEGYQAVTISSLRSGYAMDRYEGPGRINIVTPSIHICDIYTGKVLPSAFTDGDTALVNSTNLSWEGISYSLDYAQDVVWNWGEWSDWNDMGLRYALGTAIGTNTIAIPMGYDGLAILVSPITEKPDPDWGFNVFDNDNEKYILDEWKDGSYLMRVSDLYNILNGQ